MSVTKASEVTEKTRKVSQGCRTSLSSLSTRAQPITAKILDTTSHPVNPAPSKRQKTQSSTNVASHITSTASSKLVSQDEKKNKQPQEKQPPATVAEIKGKSIPVDTKIKKNDETDESKMKSAWRDIHLANKDIRDLLTQETLGWAVSNSCCIVEILEPCDDGGQGCCHADASIKLPINDDDDANKPRRRNQTPKPGTEFQMKCFRCDMHLVCMVWPGQECISCGANVDSGCGCDHQAFFEWRMARYGLWN